MYYLNLREGKSGRQEMQTPIMLCLKARGIRTTPPDNSYNNRNNQWYLNFVIGRLYNGRK